MLAFLTAALLPLAPPASPVDTLQVFRIDTLAPGVFAALVLPRPDAYAFANSLVVVGDSAVLVVDTQQSPAAAGVLVEHVRAHFHLPVRWVVNTHWHGDHVYGNQSWQDAWPGARFVAHPATVEGMRGPGREQLADERAALPPSIEERERWLETGQGPSGQALSDEDRAAVAYSLRLRRSQVDQLARLRWVEPEPVVGEPVTVDLGGRTVELLPMGPAHTEGDVAVWVPDAGVLAVGDLLEEAAPWVEGADIQGWAEALEHLAALAPEVVLPAHGGVQRDRRLLEGQAALFGDLAAGARRARAEGWGEDEALRRIDLSAHRAFLATLGVEGEAFERFREAAVRQALTGGA